LAPLDVTTPRFAELPMSGNKPLNRG